MDFFKPKEEFLQYYFYFISERQNIFWNRLEKGLFQYSYTKDPILHKYKFTNVYRLLDRTTQYMLSEVIMVGKKHKYSRRDMFWRIMIFKHFNKPATWQYLIKKFGDITAETPLLDIISAIDEFSKINKPYSDVYILTSRIFVTNLELRKTLGFTKNDNPHWWGYYLSSYEIFIKKQELDVHILKSDTTESIFKSLKEITGIGDFLAYQYTQDLLYANLFKFDCAKAHNDFCITGLGTKRGIERCFHINTKTINTEYIKILQYIQINFKELMGEYAQQFKPLSSNWYPKMPDLCNCFCEIDKYLRIKEHKQQIKLSRYYRQPNTIKYVFPEGWGIPEIN